MLEYNEITPKKVILVDGEPYEVLDSHVFRMQQRKPQNKAKLKGVINGRVVELTFHQSEKAEEAEIDEKEVKYLYQSRGDWWFSSPDNPADRFKLSEEVLGEGRKFLKVNSVVTARIFDDKIFGVKLPITVELKVTESPNAVRGDSSKGGTKQVIVETGASINAPLFINEGDIIKINTETGEYRERVS
jgi:elongation factor P